LQWVANAIPAGGKPSGYQSFIHFLKLCCVLAFATGPQWRVPDNAELFFNNALKLNYSLAKHAA
jgi:hypothetical protein